MASPQDLPDPGRRDADPVGTGAAGGQDPRPRRKPTPAPTMADLHRPEGPEPPGQRDHQRLRCPVGSPGAAHSTAGLLEPVFWPYLSGRANLRAFARLDDAASAFAGGETVVRAVLAGMIVVPFAFAGGPLLQESVPAGTLFRRWAPISGFASPLLRPDRSSGST